MAAHEVSLATAAGLWVDEDAATVIVRGEIDIATVSYLRERLAEAAATNPKRLGVDLAATSFIDCSGIGAIAHTAHQMPSVCPVILRSPHGLVRRVIELTGMDRMCLIDQ